MDLKINKEIKYDEIDVGDIVVIDGESYIVRIDHGQCNTDALLLGLSGDSDKWFAYNNMNSLRKNVASMDNVEHYKASEYELRLFKK